MDENVNEEKKLSDETEDQLFKLADDNRIAKCKSNPQHYVQRSGKAGFAPMRSSSFHKKSNFGKVGFRKPDVSRAASVAKGKRPFHRRARTLMHLSHVQDQSGIPKVEAKQEVATVAELKTALVSLSEQFSRMEQRFDKQLGAFHKRFETMEKMQLTILGNIRKLAGGDDSQVKTTQQNAPSAEIRQDMISMHI